ncbi:helix-turn-helix domain-containing protein [Selenomonas sp.]|uniref:helix-turn-helix domain-containing protein n=1 Tax=Selenomonas sp. TaxID=2053611 RepID=UPI0025DFE22E|nr:helix-turn-helix domain-containing protein [Selenomonas sp.]
MPDAGVMDALGGWLSEIRYFYMRQVSVPLSPHGQALWHWLMWRANTVFWQFPLRLSMAEIAGGTKMSESMVKRARGELVQGGFLLHEAFGGNKPAGYWLLSCIKPGEVIAPRAKGTTAASGLASGKLLAMRR